MTALSEYNDPTEGSTMSWDVGGGTGPWAESQTNKFKRYLETEYPPSSYADMDWGKLQEQIDAGEHPSLESWRRYELSPQYIDQDEPKYQMGANLESIEEVEDQKEKYEAEDKHLDDALAEADRREAMSDEEWLEEFGEEHGYKKSITKEFQEWTTSSYQLQRDVSSLDEYWNNDWGPAGLAKDSNIENLKNFIRE